jgi:YaiO family outer membrane protein
VAPDAEIVARTDAYLELTQALPRDLEGSAGVRHARYRGDRVTVVSGAVARYQGPWYLRGAVFVTPKGGETAVSFGGVARRFLAGPGDLMELGVGVGREVVTVGEGPIVELRTSRSAALRGVRWVGSGVGLEAAVQVASIAGVPTGVAASVGILGRW